MMNNLNIAQDIWRSQYATDFALLDTPQEQIKFLKDLLLKNKENVIEVKKLPQFAPSDLQLTNQINDEFAPHKPTEKEWMKRWDEVNKELVLPVIRNQNHLSILRAEQELLISKLYKIRQEQEHQPLSASEFSSKRKPHTAFIDNELRANKNRGESWEKFKQLANDSVGKNQVELFGYGKIYLRRVRKNPEKEILFSHEPFDFDKAENLPDGVDLIKKASFDKAWTQIRQEPNMNQT